MSVGLRVMRGPDWDQEDADGGEGHLGTVVEVKVNESTVEVLWDNGKTVTCRVGKDDKHDLRIYDNAPAGVIHRRVSCDACNMSPIRGLRWKCMVCYDYDLCSECYCMDLDNTSHQYQRFTKTQDCGWKVAPREDSTKIQVQGIFRGAKVKFGRNWEEKNTIPAGGKEVVGTVVGLENKPNEASKSRVRVCWPTGKSLQHRLGLHGNVDLICTESAPGPYCYPEHLPLLALHTEGDKDAGTEAGDIQEGDYVRVGVDYETLRLIQMQGNGWEEDMIRIVGKTGQVVKRDAKGDWRVEFELGTFSISPVALAKGRVEDVPLDPGTNVQIIGNEAKVRRLQEETVGWNEKMAEFLGCSGVVKAVDENGHCTVDFGNKQVWRFHRHCCRRACEPDVLRSNPEDSDEDELMDVPAQGGRVPRDAERHQDQMLQAGLQLLQQEVLAREAKPSPRPKTTVDLGEDTPLKRLLAAVRAGQTSTVAEMLDEQPDLVKEKVEDGSTVLHAAAYAGHEDILRLLVERGAQVNQGDETGDTPLLRAIDGQDEDAVLLLKELGADLNQADHSGRTPLHKALQERLGDIFHLLLKEGADVNRRDCVGDTPLFKALEDEHSDPQLVEALLAQESLELDAFNRRGSTAVHLAALSHPSALRKLLEMRPELVSARRRDDDKQPLHLAALGENKECLQILLEAKADIDARDRDQSTPLHLASSNAVIDSVMFLVEHDANINSQDKDGDTPLHNSILGSCLRVRNHTRQLMARQTGSYLVYKGARPDIPNHKGQTFQHLVQGMEAMKSRPSTARVK